MLRRMLDPQFCVLANSTLSGVVVTKAPGAGVVDRIGRLTRPARTPLGRTGRPDDIRGVAVFVVSDDSQWMMGKQLMAAGRRR